MNNQEYKIPIRMALKILETNIESVSTVCEWAQLMGYDGRIDADTFHWRIKAKFDSTPGELLKEKRKGYLTRLLKENQQATLGEVAWKFNQWMPKQLHQYVRRHFGCTPSELRNKFIEGT